LNTPNTAIAALKPAAKRGFFRWLIRSKLFLFTVILPTILAIFYYGFIAADVYISESRFIVRSPQRAVQTGFLSSILQGTGFSRSQEDAMSVHDFIRSRDALKTLDGELALGKSFSAPTVDVLNRFGALDWDTSFEALHKFYNKRVAVSADASSGISILRVSAFSAEQAFAINERLLVLSERLVNQLSNRGREDVMKLAIQDVVDAEKKAKEAALAVASYRSQNTVVDPEKQTTYQLQQVSKLQDELINTRAQLLQLRSLSPDNPQVPVLKNRIDGLQAAVDAELSKMTGSASSLTNKAAAFERLALDRAFAEKQLANAMAALEVARSETQRKQLYLERIVQPNKPDIAIEPRRLRSVIVIFMLGLVAWGILTLLAASIREHME
jgi:capsular polysaccharide transport system permease protein